jgi:hypothetical protein
MLVNVCKEVECIGLRAIFYPYRLPELESLREFAILREK